jgi:hypothetical protein
MLEPFLQLLPRESKSLWVRYGSWVMSPFVYTFMYHHQLLNRYMPFSNTAGMHQIHILQASSSDTEFAAKENSEYYNITR